MADTMRSIMPKKKPVGGTLTFGEEDFNRRVSSDRIIVENFFGWCCTLWATVSTKCRWGEALYDPLFRICVGLTNLHIINHPLRSQDQGAFNWYKNRLYNICVSAHDKRRAIQKRYRLRRARRINTIVHGRESSSRTETDTTD